MGGEVNVGGPLHSIIALSGLQHTLKRKKRKGRTGEEEGIRKRKVNKKEKTAMT
jgi:hypothetical protein